MNWKAYTLLTGASVIATWMAVPPTAAPMRGVVPIDRVPAAPQASPRSAAQRSLDTSDIEQQASRLQQRLRHDVLYEQPSRNPFRFGLRPAPAAAPRPRAEMVLPPDVQPQAPPIPMKLAGIAIDETMRTAVLSTTSGVVLAQAGEEVLGYRLTAVGEDAIDLIRTSDGSPVRLTLK